MKYMMLLIIVTNLHFGTQREASGVCIQKSVENLEHCSFAGSVVSNQCYALASFDLERNIGKKFLLRETFGEIFYGKDIVSTDHAWLKRKTHLALDFDRFVNPLNLIQHLFTALCTFDGFFSVERFQLDDNGFLMFDLALLVEICLVLGITKLCFFLCISGVITGIHTNLSGIDLDDFCDNFVQKIAVMRYNENSTRIIEKISFQPGNAFHIQVVGRLIEQKDIWFGNQQFTEGNTCFLTAGKSRHLFGKILFCKSETIQNTHKFAFVGIAILQFKFMSQAGVGVHQAVKFFAGSIFHLDFHGTKAFFHIDDILFGA